MSCPNGFASGNLPNAVFDGDLPKAANAHQLVIRLILNQRATFAAQRGIPADEPKESVRVEQKLHSM